MIDRTMKERFEGAMTMRHLIAGARENRELWTAISSARILRPVMRRRRPFAVVLLGVLLLQLSLLGARLTCLAAPAGGTAAGVVHHAASEGEHSTTGHGHHIDRGPGPADAPTSDGGSAPQDHDGQMHCPAAMSCATAAIAGVSVALPSATLVNTARVAALDSDAPASITGAPEPPPPRV